jgi:hypothetical protein
MLVDKEHYSSVEPGSGMIITPISDQMADYVPNDPTLSMAQKGDIDYMDWKQFELHTDRYAFWFLVVVSCLIVLLFVYQIYVVCKERRQNSTGVTEDGTTYVRMDKKEQRAV